MTHTRDLARLLFVVLVMTWVVAAQTSGNRKTKAETTFDQLASLAGEWQAFQGGVPVKETYTLTADGSALMVETKPGTESPMVTLVTVDGARVRATHYCSAHNQPEMVAVPGDLTKGVSFSLSRVTGLKTPQDWHNTGVTITLNDRDHMTQRWTWLYKGKAGTTVFHYTRNS